MADRDSAPPGNGTFWNRITAGFRFFRSREADSSTATAPPTRSDPLPGVPAVTVQSGPPRPSGAGIAAATRQDPAALEAYLTRQWADYLDRTQPRLESLIGEHAEHMSRQNERRTQMARRIQNNEEIPDEELEQMIQNEARTQNELRGRIRDLQRIQNELREQIALRERIQNEEGIRFNDERFSNFITDYERDIQGESPTATAATTRTNPQLGVPPGTVESDRASPSGMHAATREGPAALEAYLERQRANSRYNTTPRLASSLQEYTEYTDWQNERLPDFIVDEEIDVEPESTLAAETPDVTAGAAKYLAELQSVAINDLAEDGRICGICREPYNTDEDPEQACKVGHCGHVLGRTCLSKWVTPAGSRPNNTCPLCRAVLFEADPPDLSDAFDVNDIDRVFLLDATTTGQDFNDGDWLDEDEELLSDLPAVEVEEPHRARQMVNGRYASGLFDPAIVDVISSTQGRAAWDYVRTQRLVRARAEIAQPSYMLSEYVLAYFRIFIYESNVGSSATIAAGLSVSRIMGQLYVRQREDMERTAGPIIWTEYGLPLSLLLDPATIPLIESALERLVHIELQRYAADN